MKSEAFGGETEDRINLREIEKLGLRETVGNLSIGSLASYLIDEVRHGRVPLDFLNDLMDRLDTRMGELDEETPPKTESSLKIIKTYLEQKVKISIFFDGVEFGRETADKKEVQE